MSSLVRRIQRGKGNFIGLLTSGRARWGAKIGVHNERERPNIPHLSRRAPFHPPWGSRRGARNKAYIERRKKLAAERADA